MLNCMIRGSCMYVCMYVCMCIILVYPTDRCKCIAMCSCDMWFSSSVVACRDGIPEALGSSPGRFRLFFSPSLIYVCMYMYVCMYVCMYVYSHLFYKLDLNLFCTR